MRILTPILASALFLYLLEAYAEEKPVIYGIASWYGGGERLNRYTASGEPFNPNDLTCAIWDLPFGTILKVTNLRNGKSVIVRVNDRGPAKRLNRVIDLTKRAFSQIEALDRGLCKVKIEVIYMPKKGGEK